MMVQEYVRGGSLDRVRRKLGGRMTEFQAMHLVLLPLLNVLQHLHSKGIVHRDIKPVRAHSWLLSACLHVALQLLPMLWWPNGHGKPPPAREFRLLPSHTPPLSTHAAHRRTCCSLRTGSSRCATTACPSACTRSAR